MHDQSIVERVPPQSIEAEMSTLGSMLIDRDAIAKVIDMLEPDDFTRKPIEQYTWLSAICSKRANRQT